MNKPSPEALQAMRDRPGTWAAYENVALDSADLGHLRFLKYGPDCTLKEPPEKYPDTSLGIVGDTSTSAPLIWRPEKSTGCNERGPNQWSGTIGKRVEQQ